MEAASDAGEPDLKALETGLLSSPAAKSGWETPSYLERDARYNNPAGAWPRKEAGELTLIWRWGWRPSRGKVTDGEQFESCVINHQMYGQNSVYWKVYLSEERGSWIYWTMVDDSSAALKSGNFRWDCPRDSSDRRFLPRFQIWWAEVPRVCLRDLTEWHAIGVTGACARQPHTTEHHQSLKHLNVQIANFPTILRSLSIVVMGRAKIRFGRPKKGSLAKKNLRKAQLKAEETSHKKSHKKLPGFDAFSV